MPRLLNVATTTTELNSIETSPMEEEHQPAERDTELARDALNLQQQPTSSSLMDTTTAATSLEQKEKQLSNNASHAMQHIHIISSDDEEDALSVLSGKDGFAGFPSPGNNVLTVTPSTSRHSLKRTPVKDDANCGGMELRKRSSYNSRPSAANENNVDLEQITPVKRKKCPNENDTGELPETPPEEITPKLETPPDQIVEVTSNSTTHSQRQKRLQRRNAQNIHINTKFSTESSSEFPVSSPSNPQPGGSKYSQRPPLLKNTLPADSFERNLALITTRNPQMTLEDKMSSWQCEPELSDVEDVNAFDDLFQRCEENKRKTLKGTKNKMANATELKENYDFAHFRNVILKNLKSQIDLSHEKDKPTTSTVGNTQRRQKYAAGGDCLEKKHQQKDTKAQSSTTPPPASSSSPSTSPSSASSENNKYYPHKKTPQKNSPKVLVYEKVLCPSSSEASQTSKKKKTQTNAKANVITSPTKPVQEKVDPSPSANVLDTPPLNLHWTSTDEDSVFRLNRLNREIDKSPQNHCNRNDPKGLIQMRLDFVADKKDLNLKEKIGEIFKTPIVPQKYQHHLNNNNYTGFSAKPTTSTSPKAPQLQDNSKSKRQSFDETSSSPPPPPNGQQLGFHQQHEFCSYLGLTGMSTANAVANAVAELAKCNLTRRSLRVRRLQHEQEKTVKEKKQLEELKSKQLNEIKKREKSPKETLDEITEKMEGTTINRSNLNSLQQRQNSMYNSLNSIASPTPSYALNDIKKEPEIKIICRIAADDKDEVESISKKYVQQITAPIRRTLMRHLKRGTSSNGTSTCPRSSHSGEPDEESVGNNRITRQTAATCPMTRSQMQIKQEIQSVHSRRSSHSSVNIPNECDDKEEDKNSNIQMLHMKFQEYLEASRRAKPSIFIVESIDNEKQKKENSIAEQTKETAKPQTSPSSKGPKLEAKENYKSPQRVANTTIQKRKNKATLRRLLTRSVLNLSQQRQLRSRKIVILKTIKRDNPKNNETKRKQINTDANVAASHSPRLESLRDRSPMQRNYSNKHKNITLLDNNLPVENPIENSLIEQEEKTKRETKVSDNEAVVVSSTTNCFDETKEITNNCIASKGTFVMHQSVFTKDSATQSEPNGISYIKPPSSPLLNPLKSENGKVLYIYYELDILIVVQETLISFWKYSKLINVLSLPQPQVKLHHNQHHSVQQQQQREAESTSISVDISGEWLHLGECKRLVHDIEISSPYPNRICVHNSIPIYIEMRCKELQKERRDCNLLSLYINAYYYNDDDMHVKMHSIQLDSVQSLPISVIYTTITDSRYFVMSWPQENILGKMRSGLCKYSLTPHLDTLASIREFKSMRHEVLYLECTDDDKLLGFGATQITIWDHRSGDVLMNYDLDLQLGRNLGSVYYPSLEIGQNSMLLLFQLVYQRKEEGAKEEETAEIHVIACNISHAAPSHRVLYRHSLPSPTFTHLSNAINTGEHLLLTAPNDEEIWINCGDPKMLTFVPGQGTRRFYTRGSSQLIELTERTLTVDNLANHVLKIAAEP